jgi:hypothetical protein
MMKKMMLMVTLLFLLTGCIFQENTIEFKQLSDSFEQYQLSDIVDDSRFELLLETITYQATVSSLKLEIRVYTALGILIETRFVSGFIFAENQDDYYALTDLTSTEVESPYELWIQVTDYKNETYRGYLVTRSEDLGLSAIRFAKDPLKTLKVPTFADTMPYIGEPVVLIGYVNRTLNGVRMGLVSNYEALPNGNHIMNTSIPSDSFASGSLILNIHAEIIGIQFGFTSGFSQAYDVNQIQLMIDDIII